MERVGTLALARPSCAVPTPGSPRSLGNRGPALGGGGRVWPPGGSSFPATRNMAALRPGCAARCGMDGAAADTEQPHGCLQHGLWCPHMAAFPGPPVTISPCPQVPACPCSCTPCAQSPLSPSLRVPTSLCPHVPGSLCPHISHIPPGSRTFSPAGRCRQRWLPVPGMRSRSGGGGGAGGVPALRCQQEAPRAERPPPSPGLIKAAARCRCPGKRYVPVRAAPDALLRRCPARRRSLLHALDIAHGRDSGSGTGMSPSPSTSVTATSLGTPDVSSSGSEAGTAHALPTKAAASTTPPPNPVTTVSPSSTPASTVLKAPFSDTAATSLPAAPTSSSDTATASSPSGITGSPGPPTTPSNTTMAPPPSRTPGSVEASSPSSATTAPSPSQPAVPSSAATGHSPSSTAAPAPSSPGSSKPPPAPSSPAVSPGPSSTLATSTRMAPAIGTSAVVGSSAQPPTKPSPAVVAIICLFICLLVGGAAVLLVWLSRRRNPRFQHLDESNPGVPPAAE
ncbi:putative LOC729966 homolog isoform 2-T2 [Guaruba guarouba]